VNERTRSHLTQLTIRPGQTIRHAMTKIDEGTVALALVVDGDKQLVGTVSDGDIRRALLAGATLDDAVDAYVSNTPVTVTTGTDRAAVLDIMRARRLAQIPEVDSQGRLIRLHVMQEILGANPKSNLAVVLAGGRGTRLGALTKSIPKPMLSVAGRPILERLVLHLVGSGLHHIALSVGYLAEEIIDHFGDGEKFGCSIEYLREDPSKPLGTGGPLRLLLERAEPVTEPLLVMNGDLISSFSVDALLAVHEATEALLTLALTEYVHDVPFGMASLHDEEPHRVIALQEKPRWTGLANAGIYCVSPQLLKHIPAGRPFPITELAEGCLARNERVSAWRMTSEWQDIGRPLELARARGE
jgi:dTDP-glucose pyrophosphorylase